MTHGQSTMHRIASPQLCSYQLFTMSLGPYKWVLFLFLFKNHCCTTLQLSQLHIPLAIQLRKRTALVTIASPPLLFLLSFLLKWPRQTETSGWKGGKIEMSSNVTFVLTTGVTQMQTDRLLVPLHLKQRGYPAIMALEQQKQTNWLVLAGRCGSTGRLPNIVRKRCVPVHINLMHSKLMAVPKRNSRSISQVNIY